MIIKEARPGRHGEDYQAIKYPEKELCKMIANDVGQGARTEAVPYDANGNRLAARLDLILPTPLGLHAFEAKTGSGGVSGCMGRAMGQALRYKYEYPDMYVDYLGERRPITRFGFFVNPFCGELQKHRTAIGIQCAGVKVGLVSLGYSQWNRTWHIVWGQNRGYPVRATRRQACERADLPGSMPHEECFRWALEDKALENLPDPTRTPLFVGFQDQLGQYEEWKMRDSIT